MYADAEAGYLLTKIELAKFPMKRRYSLSILTLGKIWRIKVINAVSNEL